MPIHVPVMPETALEVLDLRGGQIVVDCTVGAGGHSRRFAERVGPEGRIIALDADPTMIQIARQQLNGLPVTLVHSNFDRLRDVLDSLQIAEVDAVFADLGFCSDQLSDPDRGFSFQTAGPLDMRLDATQGPTAAELLASMDERELADVFWNYGEERYSRRIARRIVQSRQAEPLTATAQLAELVRRCVPRGRMKIDPATRTFQALRIAVNDELRSLDSMLRQLARCVRVGGRAAIISFHSLEDRMVKRAFRDATRWQAMTKKPLTADDDEQHVNPRSRSAKLRAAIRLADAGGRP